LGGIVVATGLAGYEPVVSPAASLPGSAVVCRQWLPVQVPPEIIEEFFIVADDIHGGFA